MSLAKYLKRMSMLEGPTGAAYLEVRPDVVLRQLEHSAQNLRGVPEEVIDWQLVHAPTDEFLGNFSTRQAEGEPFAEMFDTWMPEKHRGKGYATDVYRKLADHFGALVSDRGTTSDQAKAVYRRITKDPEAVARELLHKEPTANSWETGPRLGLRGKKPKNKGWGLFGEDPDP